MTRPLVTNILLIALTVAWLLPFWQLMKYGHITAHESHPLILAFELALLVAVMAYAVVNIIKTIGED